MAVIPMSEREVSRLRIIVELADARLTVAAAAALLGIGRRQAFRLRQALVTAVSRKCGRPSNRRRGATFRRTVLTLVRERSTPTSDATLAAEKLAERHGLRLGVETLRHWMSLRECGSTVATACPHRTNHVAGASASVSWCRSMARNAPGSRVGVRSSQCLPSTAGSCCCAFSPRDRPSKGLSGLVQTRCRFVGLFHCR